MKIKWCDIAYCLLLVWIIVVSMIDHYYTIKLSDVINDNEKNPLGIMLINADNGSVALFMTLKMMFLWVIYLILKKVYSCHKRIAFTCAGALALFQFLLLIYFTWGHLLSQ